VGSTCHRLREGGRRGGLAAVVSWAKRPIGPAHASWAGWRKRAARVGATGPASASASAGLCGLSGLGLRSWLLGCRACPPLKRKRGTGGLPVDGPQANLGPERKGGLRDKWEGLANLKRGLGKDYNNGIQI
jgi:hypothetical protein